MNISVVPNLERDTDGRVTLEVIARLKALGASVYLADCGLQADCAVRAYPDLYSNADVIIAVGGDGTILHTAKHAAEFDKPVLGINAGHLGYTAGLEKDELDSLPKLFDGDYTISNRMMLKAVVRDGGEETFYCLNDAVVSKGSLSRIIQLSVTLEGQTIDYRADGVIFATPTGSTAYSVSAGGPVVDPSISGILLTPICPHSLISRTIFLSADAALQVSADAPDGTGVYLTADGERVYPLIPGATVEITKAERTARLIRIKNDSFYSILHKKMMN